MLTNLILIALIVGFALAFGWALDLRKANLELQTTHARASLSACHTTLTLRNNLAEEHKSVERLIIHNRQLTCNVVDMSRERHRLLGVIERQTAELEQLQVDHAKHVLGGTVLPVDGRGQE